MMVNYSLTTDSEENNRKLSQELPLVSLSLT